MNQNKNISCFICIMGIDGSGKTTHALALLRALSENGVNAVHVSPRSSLIRILLPKRIRKLVKRIYVRPRNLMISSVGKSRKAMFRIFLFIPILVYALLTYLAIIKPLLSEFVVVCDRYFYDLLLNLFGKRALLLVRLIPRPNLGFILDLPVDQAFLRMHDMEDRRVSREFYVQLRTWYVNLARQYNFLVVDSTDEIETVKRTILTFSSQWLGIYV